MCTMLLHSQITTQLNKNVWSTKHHGYLTQTERSSYVEETALDPYIVMIFFALNQYENKKASN